MAQADTRRPTAANIISSLGVKGAIPGIPSGEDASAYANFIPVLDENGKLSVDFIPSSAVEKVVKPIYNVAIVDLSTTVTERTGSAIAPFKSIHEAAEKFGLQDTNLNVDSSGRCAIVLMPGIYKGNNNSRAEFSVSPSEVFLIGIGKCVLDVTTFTVTGVNNANIFLQNLSTSSNITVRNAASVVCLGHVYVGAWLNVGSAALKLSDESRITSTDATNLSYLSEAAYVGNTSGVRGKTVSDALDRLGKRKIRVAKVKYESSRFDLESSSYSDISADSSGSCDIYDLRARDRVFIEGINDVIDKTKNIVAETVTATRIMADEVRAKTLRIDSLALGGYNLGIDTYGYLVVLDGDSEITPPKGVILIKDTGSSGNGDIYAISVANGRLYIDDGADSSSSSSQEVLQRFTLTDARTGEEYVVTMVNGRLVVDSAADIGASAVDYAPRLYALDEDTGKYHQIVAVTANGKTTLKVVQTGISDVQLEAILST